MLQSAFPYKDVFAKLKLGNPQFKFPIPNDDEWRLASLVCKKLEIFYKATLLFFDRKYPMANLFFKQVCEIKIALLDWLKSEEPINNSMAERMMEKFDKYWASIKGVLAVAAVLDPRDKLQCVAFYYNFIFDKEADDEIDNVKSLLYDILTEYREKEDSSYANGTRKGGLNAVNDLSSGIENVELGTSQWDMAKKNMTQNQKVSVKSDIDLYLEGSPVPNSPQFDVLHSWRLDTQFPTLRKVLKDILAIPASSVASKSAFSSGGRLISAHRAKLHSKTVEALTCLQNWMLEDISGCRIDNNCAWATCADDEDLEEESETSDLTDVFCLEEGEAYL